MSKDNDAQRAGYVARVTAGKVASNMVYIGKPISANDVEPEANGGATAFSGVLIGIEVNADLHPGKYAFCLGAGRYFLNSEDHVNVWFD